MWLRRDRGAVWGCARARCGAAQGRSVGLCGGAAWGYAGTGAQRGAAQGRSTGLCSVRTVLLHKGTAGGCAGAQRGAARVRSLRLRRGGTRLQGHLTTGSWRPCNATSASLGGCWRPVGA